MIAVPEQYAVQVFYQHVSHTSYNKITRTYNGSCPFCKEGKSFGKKKRFFYIPKTETCYCHNCGYSKKVLSFVLDITGKPFSIIVDEIQTNGYDEIQVTREEEKKVNVDIKTLPEDCINLLEPTQLQFYNDNAIVRIALEFIVKRRLYTAVNRPKTFYLSLVDRVHKNRLILPFYDTIDDIIFYQTRTLLDSDNFKKPKYLSKVGGVRSLYGIHSVDKDNENIFLLEGPIDSFFIKNGLAVGGIQDESDKMYNELQQQQLLGFSTYNKIWVLDNQWCDDASLKKSEILLNLGENVFIWPENLKEYKDINEYCIDKQIDEFSQKIILDNVYQGLQGLLMLQMLKSNK